MIRIGLAIATVTCGLVASVALAGEYNQVLSIGDRAPDWEGLLGVDDKPHSMDDWASQKVMVVVFTCNSCPYAVDAEDRLIELHKKYADRGVALVAINVNKVDEDLLPAMKEKAERKDLPSPISSTKANRSPGTLEQWSPPSATCSMPNAA